MRNILLSGRMEAVVEMISSQPKVVADVGCDHAYVSIALIKRGLAGHVIAMDVKRGPLKIAKNNIEEQHLENEIELRLSDGLYELQPEEADAIVIAGMGGLLMVRILSDGRSLLEGVEKRPCLVLQPQSDIDEVRIFLQEISYHIEQEKMLVEDGKYYTVIKALPGAEELPYEKVELIYGRHNLMGRDKTLYTYLEKESEELDKIEGKLKRASGSAAFSERSKARISEVAEQRKLNLMARQYYREVQDEL